MTTLKQDISRKKQAYTNHLRKQYLNNYFTQQRKLLCQNIVKTKSQSQKVSALQQQVWKLINQLPQTAVLLQERQYSQSQIVSEVILQNMEGFCAKIVGVDYVQWSHMVAVLNKMLVMWDKPQWITLIIRHSLLPVLQTSEILIRKHHQSSLILSSISQTTLQYIFRLGGYILHPNQLQQNSLLSILQHLWTCTWDQQQQINLVVSLLNILHANYDEDDIQNVTPVQTANLNMFKRQLIIGLFYCKEEAPARTLLMARVCQLAQQQPQQSSIFELYLKILINITFHLESPAFYYPLLRQHLLMPIQLLIYHHKQNMDSSLVCYGLRLFNNLIVNQYTLTVQIMEQILMANIVHAYYRGNNQVKNQVVDLFVNLLHFCIDDQDIIRGLTNIGVPQILLQALDRKCDEDTTKQISSSFVIMHSHNKYNIKRLILEKQHLIRLVIEKYPLCADHLEHLLQEVKPWDQNEDRL